MDPKDLELIKNAVEAAVKAYAEGAVPFSYVAAVVSGLVAGLAALWAWGLNKDKHATEEVRAWAAKIEELSNGQRKRDDEREAEIRTRYDSVIAQIKNEQKDLVSNYEKKIERLEAARDMARDQYNNYRNENDVFVKGQLMEVTRALDEASEINEATITQLERIAEAK